MSIKRFIILAAICMTIAGGIGLSATPISTAPSLVTYIAEWAKEWSGVQAANATLTSANAALTTNNATQAATITNLQATLSTNNAALSGAYTIINGLNPPLTNTPSGP